MTISPDDGEVQWMAKNAAEIAGLEAEVASLKLQNEEIRKALDCILFCWGELKTATAANVPSGEFREDDERAERKRVAEMNLRMALDRNEKQKTDKPKDVVTQWDERGAVVEKRNCAHEYIVDTDRGPGSFCRKCSQVWLPT